MDLILSILHVCGFVPTVFGIQFAGELVDVFSPNY
jgi:hypothetical protein